MGLTLAAVCCCARAPQAKDALQLGLVDQMVKPDELMMAAGKLALMIAAGKVPRRVTSKLNDKIGSYEMAKAVIETGRAGALKKNRNLPQPFAYLDAVEAGVRDGFEAGLDKEITLMAGLVMHPVAKSLMVRRTDSDGVLRRWTSHLSMRAHFSLSSLCFRFSSSAALFLRDPRDHQGHAEQIHRQADSDRGRAGRRNHGSGHLHRLSAQGTRVFQLNLRLRALLLHMATCAALGWRCN